MTLQGKKSIILTNGDGDTVARYSYDAWGKCAVEFDSTGYIANINPFRYRGYYLDRETNLYYLQSRYYDAEFGRFVNGDMAGILLLGEGILPNNLSTYCDNNTVNNFDFYGYKSCFVHIARVISGVAGLAGSFTAIGKAVPILKRVIVASLIWTIKVTGATGRLAACLIAIMTLVLIILALRSLYDMARVFLELSNMLFKKYDMV